MGSTIGNNAIATLKEKCLLWIFKCSVFICSSILCWVKQLESYQEASWHKSKWGSTLMKRKIGGGTSCRSTSGCATTLRCEIAHANFYVKYSNVNRCLESLFSVRAKCLVIWFCWKVNVDTVLIEHHATAKAIVDLIPFHNITNLVIGMKKLPNSRYYIFLPCLFKSSIKIIVFPVDQNPNNA